MHPLAIRFRNECEKRNAPWLRKETLGVKIIEYGQEKLEFRGNGMNDGIIEAVDTRKGLH